MAVNLGGSSAREIALPLLAHMVAQARQLQPRNRDTAMVLAKNRQWADAEVALVKVITAAPSDGQAWYQLGVTRYELGDLLGAEAALSEAATMLDSPGSPMFMLAIIAAAQGRIDTAFERLARAAEASGEKPDLNRAELRALESDSRWAKILEKVKAARRRNTWGNDG